MTISQEAWDDEHELREKAEAQLVKLTGEQGVFKDAVIDACVVSGIYCAGHETDPRRAINDLLIMQHRLSLDPMVSKEAAELVNRAKAECATLRQELTASHAAQERLHEQIEDLDSRLFDETWNAEEHQKAVAAIQQSESLEPNHYPSFTERVWWKTFKDRAEAAEAECATLRAQLAVVSSESQTP